MKLVVFGDSWAYGSDIDERKNNNYAKLLQKKLNAVSVDNRANQVSAMMLSYNNYYHGRQKKITKIHS